MKWQDIETPGKMIEFLQKEGFEVDHTLTIPQLLAMMLTRFKELNDRVSKLEPKLKDRKPFTTIIGSDCIGRSGR
jgi:hypothetical protein